MNQQDACVTRCRILETYKGLINQLNAALFDHNFADFLELLDRGNVSEGEAYAVSDPIPPQYLYQGASCIHSP